MAIELLKPQISRKYTGLSTDIKPTLGNNDTGAELFETDTNLVYTWQGTKWVENAIKSVFPSNPFPVNLATTENDPLQVSSGDIGLNMFSSLKESIDEMVVQMKILNKYMAEGFDNEIKEEDIL